jgi:hypothetical protein
MKCGQRHKDPIYQTAAIGEDAAREPTADELESFRRKHWMHWTAAENLMIALLVRKLRASE